MVNTTTAIMTTKSNVNKQVLTKSFKIYKQKQNAIEESERKLSRSCV